MKHAIILFIISFICATTGGIFNDLTDMNTLSFILISFGVISLIGGMAFIVATEFKVEK